MPVIRGNPDDWGRWDSQPRVEFERTSINDREAAVMYRSMTVNFEPVPIHGIRPVVSHTYDLVTCRHLWRATVAPLMLIAEVMVTDEELVRSRREAYRRITAALDWVREKQAELVLAGAAAQ